MINKGFTIVELVIALAVSSLMIAAIYGTVNMSQNSSTSINRKVVAQKNIRGALDFMAMEIRMASYNPGLQNIWLSPADCASSSGTPNYKGIQPTPGYSMADSITIEMDINNNGVIDNTANSNEIITYTYDANNLQITRATNCGQPLSFLGATVASGNPRDVLVLNDSVNVPLFRYFDYQNNEILPASLPALIPNIRTIKISIAAQTEYVDPLTNMPKVLNYSTIIVPRNHGVNLNQ